MPIKAFRNKFLWAAFYAYSFLGILGFLIAPFDKFRWNGIVLFVKPFDLLGAVNIGVFLWFSVLFIVAFFFAKEFLFAAYKFFRSIGDMRMLQIVKIISIFSTIYGSLYVAFMPACFSMPIQIAFQILDNCKHDQYLKGQFFTVGVILFVAAVFKERKLDDKNKTT